MYYAIYELFANYFKFIFKGDYKQELMFTSGLRSIHSHLPFNVSHIIMEELL